MDHEANEDPTIIPVSTAMDSSIKNKKECNSNSTNRKLRKCNLKMENNLNDGIHPMPSSPFDPYTTPFLNLSQCVENNSVSYFGHMTSDQSKHLMRLIHLFPQLHVATLKGALELCDYEPIQTIDSILYALQYRKYLEAKNQGFPLEYSVRGPRVLLLPSFLGNRSTNSNVYEQLFQDNTHLNESKVEMSDNVHPDCYPRQFGVTNPTVATPVYDLWSSNVGNEDIKDTVTIPMPPKTNPLSLWRVTDNSGKENSGHGVIIVPGSSSMAVGNSACPNPTNSDSSTIMRHTGRQNATSAEKKIVKTTKIKRVFKTKHMTCSKHYNKKSDPVKLENEPLKIITNQKNAEKILTSKPSASQASGVIYPMNDLNDCIIVENDPQVAATIKKSQCPLGDKDCNEIFHNK